MSDILNTDIYNISEVLLDVQKDYFDEQSDNTLALGMYGFINAVSSKMIQSSIKVASELSNEIFPTKARIESNIITHAILNNITDINAIPAKMDVILCLLESDFDSVLETNNDSTLILDKACKFMIGDYEYHLDYDIIISKTLLANNTSVYTARYNTDIKNILSDIEVPYLPSPYLVRQNSETYIFISCHLRQIEQNIVYNKILTNDAIDNKTYEFEFENQLASFDVYITEGNNKIHLLPILEGSSTDGILNYCWYTFIDSNTIRVKFDRNSYSPKMNTEIETDIKTTLGEKCNFKYTEEILSTLGDTVRFSYNRMRVIIMPTSESRDGQDKKSIDELKRILPREVLSRGSLITKTDLNNYFNTLNNKSNRIVFRDKVDNQFMRSYYAYVLLKDTFNNIIPTNTITMRIKETDFDLITNPDNVDVKQYIFKHGCVIGYKYDDVSNTWYGEIVRNNTNGIMDNYQFLYTIPFKAIINHNGPFISYYMTIVSDSYKLLFDYINDDVPLQFISSTVKWKREMLNNSNTYTMRFNIKQNIDMDMGVIYDEEVEDDEGNIVVERKSSLKIICVLYDSLDNPYRYTVAGPDLDTESLEDFAYNYKVDFLTDDIINEDNLIRIENLYLPNTVDDEYQYGYLPQVTNMSIYILNKFKDEDGNEIIYDYEYDELDNIIPSSVLEGYSLTNKYSILNGVSWFTNYSDVIDTVVTPSKIFDDELETVVDGFVLNSVPVLQYHYSNSERNVDNFINAISVRKAYIDTSLRILENQFSIDFKFFNTYGPAIVYTLEGSKLDRVNIGLKFNLSLTKASDSYTKDYIIKFIKDYIEDLDKIGNDFHIPNLISEITKTYSNSINYIEYTGINSYNTIYQHINYSAEQELYTVPEFININMINNDTYDIEIRVL